MGHKAAGSLRFEKKRILHRSKNFELIDGSLHGRSYLVKKFSRGRKVLWEQYLLQSRIRHPLLLTPEMAWHSRDGSFRYAMPLSFVPAAVPEDFDAAALVIEFLSLALALREREHAFLWSKDHLVYDPERKQVFLAGFSSIRNSLSTQLEENERQILSGLHEFLSKRTSAGRLAGRLKSWSRRKERPLAGCLRELLMEGDFPAERTITRFDWLRTAELELIRGLLHLAERTKRQSILFYAEEGAGKSTLRRQAALMLQTADVVVFEYAFLKGVQPYAALRSWVDHILEVTQARNTRWVQEIGTPGFTREAFASEFLSTVRKATGNRSLVFLLDDFHYGDPLSLDFLAGLLDAASSEPLLFILFSESELNAGQDTIRMPLEGCSIQDLENGIVVPFWKADQRKSYLQQIHTRTSGNPFLLNEYLDETLRAGRKSCFWTGEEWSFPQHTIPVLPLSLAEFYYRQIPTLSPEEKAFLQIASLQVEGIEAELVEPDPVIRDALIRSVTSKGILKRKDELLTFCRPLVREVIYREIEPSARRAYHAGLARELERRGGLELSAEIATNFLSAGEPLKALDFACRAARLRRSSVLAVFEGLESSVKQMEAQDQLRYYRTVAELFARTGHYSRATQCYAKASGLCGNDVQQRFICAVEEARCRILNNDILAAQQLLQEQERCLPNVHELRALMSFYFAKATVQRQRGSGDKEAFEKAVSIAEKLQDHESLAMSCRQQAELAWHRGQLAEAKALAKRTIRYALRIDAFEEAGHAFKILGSIAGRRQQQTVAIHLLKRSLKMFQRVENRDGQARVWNLLGNLYLDRCKFPQATHAFQNALVLFSALEHPLELGLARFNLGRVFLEQSRFKDAESVFSRCASADRKAGNKRDYAFDLRALAVACLLQGYYRKASRLLKRALEIFVELQLDNEVLQTKLILLHTELEQGNEKQAAGLLSDLEAKAGEIEEPRTLADIHYIAGRYYLQIQDKEQALKHIQKSLRLARKGTNHKLVGQCLILRLIAEGSVPAKENADLRRALRLLRKGGNELEAADHCLMLYEAFPELIKQNTHRRRWMSMLDLYRRVRHRKRLQQARALFDHLPGAGSRTVSIQEAWPRMLEVLGGGEPLESRLKGLLNAISEEMGSSSSLFQFLGPEGVFERITSGPGNQALDDLRLRILQMLPEAPRGLCLDLSRDSMPASASVHSVIAIPVRKMDHISGMWCFERDRSAARFATEDFNRASFFLLSASPVVEAILAKEFAVREKGRAVRKHRYENLIGADSRMQELYRQMENVAPIDISVLITGESGTGKELVARNIHQSSPRSAGPFVALNCSAIPETLIESELFGFNKGAFTGATQSKAGVIEKAGGGTLFLDEIGDLSPSAQVKLLRVIQEREIQRLGDTAVRKVDARFLFATHKDLKKLAKEGTYRQDLYYRISSYTLVVPPLRDRGQDIPALIEYFVEKYGESFGRERVRFTPAGVKALCEYSWPGNVREMENLIQTLLVNASPDSLIDTNDLPAQVRGWGLVRRQLGRSLEEARQEFEREFLHQALKENRWNKTQTAKQLQITRQGLINLIQRLGIQEP